MTWGRGWAAFIVSTRNSSFFTKCFLTLYTAQFRKILAGGWRGISHTAGTASPSPFTDWCLPAYSLPGGRNLCVALALCQLFKAGRSCFDPSVHPLWPVRETLFPNSF